MLVLGSSALPACAAAAGWVLRSLVHGLMCSCPCALQYRSPLAGLNAGEATRMKQLGVLDDVAYSNGGSRS